MNENEKIADLKNQLAEYKCLMEKYNFEDLEHLDITLFVLSGETKYQLAQLKQQLAEKEKEIEKITKIVAYKDDMDRSTTINGVKFTNEQIITLQNIDYFADKHNQDKIAFAIEQLEKVKENIHYLLIFDYNLMCKVNEQIDNQIEELKKETKI